jgi:glycosyltransferase involved in cell wall biosynthesis
MRKVIEVVASLAVGGAERVALEIAAGLNRRHAEAWRAEVCVLGPPKEAETGFERSIRTEASKRGVTLHSLGFSSPWDRQGRRQFGEFLTRQAVDLVHVHNRPRDWQVTAMGWLVGTPTIYSIHKPYTHKTRRARLLYAALGLAAPKVVCVSNAVFQQAHKVENLRADKAQVIYNGIRLEVFRPLSLEERASKRAELGWHDDRFVWICAARLDAQKAHKFLVEAMARLPATSRAQLMLAGEGPLDATLRAQVVELGLTDRVFFLGPRSDVPALLGAADGYACSSREEGHPLSLLEAMASELSIVAPRLPSIEEIATAGSPIFFGPKVDGFAESHDPQQMADALFAVESSQARASEPAHSAREHVATNFSLDSMIDNHAALYDEVLAAPLSKRLHTLRRIKFW